MDKQPLHDLLMEAFELIDGSADNPECNSQMLWNVEHKRLREILVLICDDNKAREDG